MLGDWIGSEGQVGVTPGWHEGLGVESDSAKVGKRRVQGVTFKEA